MERFKNEKIAGRVEVFTDDEGEFLAVYALSLRNKVATLFRFETNPGRVIFDAGKSSTETEALRSLMWRRIKEEARFLGASLLEDEGAFFGAHAAATLIADPRLPYAPSYCEENAILRLEQFKNPTLVFVSSPAGATSFRFQRASLSPEEPVFWDYHVFVLDDAGEVYDADTTLGYPFVRVPYLEMTFADAPWLPPQHQPYFRLYSKADALRFVRTDRSHMKSDAGYNVPVPHWNALHQTSTLKRCLEPGAPHGKTLSLAAFLQWQTGDSK